jgi:hypothetical protein
MLTYLATIAVVFALLTGLIVVQRAYQRFAQRHPELGPFREEGAGCGSCNGGHCASASTERECGGRAPADCVRR